MFNRCSSLKSLLAKPKKEAYLTLTLRWPIRVNEIEAKNGFPFLFTGYSFQNVWLTNQLFNANVRQ